MTTVGVFLTGEGKEQEAALVERLRGPAFGGALRSVSPAGRAVLDHAIGSVVSRLLALDAVDLLIAGWRKHSALVAAARATAADPSLEQVVELATHRVTSSHRPYVEVDVDGVRLAKVDFELIVAFTVIALAVAVRQGRLVALRAGRCELAVALSVEGFPVLERRGELDLAVAVRLGEGILLAGPPGAGAPVQETVPRRSIGRARMFRR